MKHENENDFHTQVKGMSPQCASEKLFFYEKVRHCNFIFILFRNSAASLPVLGIFLYGLRDFSETKQLKLEYKPVVIIVIMLHCNINFKRDNIGMAKRSAADNQYKLVFAIFTVTPVLVGTIA